MPGASDLKANQEKLADAELHFDAVNGALEGLKLIGFGVWERRGGGRRHIPCAAIFLEWRAALLRVVAASGGQHRSGPYS